MKPAPLSASEIEMLCEVFRSRPQITAVKVFGSRAKGTHRPSSDVDLALWGELDALGGESVTAELEELPLPYRFDVQVFDRISLPALREHIERVGITLYEAAERRPSQSARLDRRWSGRQ